MGAIWFPCILSGCSRLFDGVDNISFVGFSDSPKLFIDALGTIDILEYFDLSEILRVIGFDLCSYF